MRGVQNKKSSIGFQSHITCAQIPHGDIRGMSSKAHQAVHKRFSVTAGICEHMFEKFAKIPLRRTCGCVIIFQESRQASAFRRLRHGKPGDGGARMHRRIMPLPGVHPAQETNQNAGALFVFYR